MRKITFAIFAILLLGLLIICGACTSSTSEEKNNQQGAAISQITQQAESKYISFDIAQNNLPAYQPDPSNESYYDMPILYFTGIGVNDAGDAKNWIFGVRNTTGTEMLAYDKNGFTMIPWNSPDAQEISIESIVRPAQLFSQNKAVITGNSPAATSEKRDLELRQGKYILTISSGNSNRILTFSASTGELIP